MTPRQLACDMTSKYGIMFLWEDETSDRETKESRLIKIMSPKLLWTHFDQVNDPKFVSRVFAGIDRFASYHHAPPSGFTRINPQIHEHSYCLGGTKIYPSGIKSRGLSPY
jgi:hypothetical protein